MRLTAGAPYGLKQVAKSPSKADTAGDMGPGKSRRPDTGLRRRRCLFEQNTAKMQINP